MAAPYALALGIAFALIVQNPFKAETPKWSGIILRIAVVLLGFSMDLGSTLRAGRQGFLFATVTIVTTLVLSFSVGKLLKIGTRQSALIGAGTAICGGSAIAAVGSVLNADESEMSIALATVFVLNAVALYLFPVIGHALKLTPTQFGTWSGVAIHDISSVVGAASTYGGGALQTATAVKLSRTLWIIPLSLLCIPLAVRLSAGRKVSAEVSPQTKLKVPWFIGLFLLASMLRTYEPTVASMSPFFTQVAKGGLALSLFLIGSGLSREALSKVGWKPAVQGLALWAFISCSALYVVMHMS